MLARIGFDCGECDDPYSATLELCRHRLMYRALILSLSSLYREELGLIATVRRRFPHLEIWLAHTDGRQAALAECMRLGADGLIGEDGLHRLGAPQSAQPPTAFHAMPAPLPMPRATSVEPPERSDSDGSREPQEMEEQVIGEPVLTADELRALLQDQPQMPPSGSSEPD